MGAQWKAKHKDLAANARGRIFGKLSKDIMIAARNGADPEMAAIEAGAQDFEPGEEVGSTLFLTDHADLDLVSRALPAQGFTVLSAKLGYRPKNPIDPASLSPADLEEIEAFLASIDANDDVQNVFVGLAG